MSKQRLKLVASNPALQRVHPLALRDMRPLGEILVDMQAITQADLAFALERQRRLDAPLGDILISEARLTSDQLQSALAEQYALRKVDFKTDPPSRHSLHLLPATLCVQHQIVPWLLLDDVLLIATARPDMFDQVVKEAPKYGLTFLPVLADHAQIQSEITRYLGPSLARRAESRVDEAYSCRSWGHFSKQRRWFAALALCVLTLLCVLAPTTLVAAFTGLSCLVLLLSIGLKAAAAIAELTKPHSSALPPQGPDILKVPKISIMVPLLRETEITSALLRRLRRLTYPKSQLDVILVLEAEDHVTRDTVERTPLPAWMRVIEVPPSDGLLTKPRALNYALDFCHGSIVGIWDAEDAPAPDQLETVVSRFHLAPPDVVCLQGRLDYYNSRANWMARCFSIEYATWWRLIMPGLARLGCVIPLGGTTLFFKRPALEALGGWDAHNVTEDADLGIRLARKGYRTELIDTTTWEEANCQPWPWVKQRSRWLKGFAVTWIVHMRNPLQLLRDLGFYRFAMLQVFFGVALAPFLLAPVFWSYWALSFSEAHPAETWLALPWLLGGFLAAEVIGTGLHMVAVRRHAHRHLLWWAPTMSLYFLLGTIAAYKALYELVFKPFYWDKTQHGVCRTVRFHLEDRPMAAE